MAILHGLKPAPVERCRVLDVGCNQGGNLIPMAYAIPHSEFVGFDSARLPAQRAQATIDELGLKNIRIFAADILDLGPDLGQFDYIIAHGFYGWVPQAVRDRLLALCSELLTPDGVAFVSYDAMPGGHLRQMVREMMMYRVQGIENLAQREAEALLFLHLVAEARPEGDVYRALIEEQLQWMERRHPGATCHDQMSEAYRPVEFTEFVQHAQRHGLQYLDEAVLPPPPDPSYRLDVRSALESAAPGDLLRQEQLLDFLRMRMFRQTLLCRSDRVLRRDFRAESFRSLLFASHTVASPGAGPGSVVFTLPGGIKMESNHPAINALLSELGKHWPRALGFDEIEPPLAQNGLALDADGVALLVRLAVSKMIELRAWRAPVAETISEYPRASAYSRQEGRTGTRTTTLLHASVNLEDPKARRFLQLVDGTRNRNGLLDAMKLEFPGDPPAALKQGIDSALELFRSTAILEA
jgi:SAM-dependent methyltransferase/methyltransferase-like protein